MFKIKCDKCEKELKEPGALVFGPPMKDSVRVRKIHLCIRCWDVVYEFIFPK